ncbi:MAG: hypothetical protein ABW039_02455 [Sphingobium sp.]
MDPAAGLFLILLGCSDDLSDCRRIPAEPTVYVSATSCQGDHETALLSKTAITADYPTIIADCVTGQQLASLSDKPVDFRRMKAERAAGRDHR